LFRDLACGFRLGGVDKRFVTRTVSASEEEGILSIVTDKLVRQDRSGIWSNVLGIVWQHVGKLLERAMSSPVLK
jgi:hypothetical protein